MNCIAPPGPEDWQLLAYLDREADSETQFHLQKCGSCRERAKDLAHRQGTLARQLHGIIHPSPVELGEFHLRLLPSSQMLLISRHVRECPSCAREILQLEDFISDLDPHRKITLMGKAKSLVAQMMNRQEASNLTGGRLFAMRGAGKEPMIFQAGGNLIVLEIQPASNGSLSILGQVAAENQEDWNGALVRLQQDHLQEMASRVDDLGAFRCEEIIPGPIQIRITSLHDIEIIFPKIDLDD